MKRALFTAVAAASLLATEVASAHLIPAKQGTVNVVGDAVFVVLSVPISALADVDDDRNGTVDVAELERHEATLRAEIDRRLMITDGNVAATTVRLDLMLSPQHDATRDHGDQIIALKHVKLDAAPRDLRVRCDLFGAAESEKDLKLTATRHPETGTETEIAVLAPGAPEHAFFAPPPTPPSTTSGASHTAISLGMLIAAGAALVWTGRSRRKSADIC